MSSDVPLPISTAINLYLRDREHNTSQATRRAHRSRLQRFESWLSDQRDIEETAEITPLIVKEYKIESYEEKEDGGEYSQETVRSHLDTIRVFLRFCESVDAVEEGISDKVQSPRPSKSRDEYLSGQEARNALQYFEKFEYASVRHVAFLLAWRTGLRLGGMRAIDLSDLHLDEQFVEIHHRPESGTPLKNKYGGEREVSLRPHTCEVIRDYRDNTRVEIQSEGGREPLLTSDRGRRSKSNLRAIITSASQPCQWGDCPHDQDPRECDAAVNVNQSSRCPSTKSPHDVRRGSITHHLGEDMPSEMVSGRFDVSKSVLDDHYDQRSEREKRELRSEYLPGEEEEEEDEE